MFSRYDPALTLEKLQIAPEGQYFDRKSGRIHPKDLPRHLSAFANADGGVLAVGIEDNGDITGIGDKENELRQVPSAYLKTLPSYQMEVIQCTSVTGEPTQIFLYHIEPSLDTIISLTNGKTYLRQGDHSNELDAESLIRLEYSRGVRRFEEQLVADATLDDLDPQLLQEYAEKLNPVASSAVDLLKSRGLVKQKGNQLRLTNACVLLFGRYPTQFLPNARVRFIRYEGLTAQVGTRLNIVKDVTLESALPTLLRQAQPLLSAQMREFQTLTPSGIFEKAPEYPEFAWLEGLVNAVTHRDYSVSGDYIRILMFDDRIEFISPGKLPNIVTVDNIRDTRFSRNPLIARVLADFGWVRELNEGVKRIYLDMESLFLDPPEFSEPNGTVKLVLKNNIAVRSVRRISNIHGIESKLSAYQLEPMELQILSYLAHHGTGTVKQLMELTGTSRHTLNKRLSHLSSPPLELLVEHKLSPRDPTKHYSLNTKG